MSLVDKIQESYFAYADYYHQILFSENSGISSLEYLRSYRYQLSNEKIGKQNGIYSGIGQISASAKIWFY
jgi:hypothetical protein